MSTMQSFNGVSILSKDPWVVQVDKYIDAHTVAVLLDTSGGWMDEARSDMTEEEMLEETSLFAKKANSFGVGRNTEVSQL
jgi:hypothetical protein